MLSIITPVFNKYPFTKSFINDIFRLTTDYELIIVDNASIDETQKELSKIIHPNFRYIRNKENTFHSKACNQGCALADGEYVLFINNDIRVKSNHTNWTDILIPYCNDNIVGPTMGLLDNSFNFVKEANQQLAGKNTYMSGWCVASSKENWNKLDVNNNGQIFDEQFPMYFNDTNMGFMCHKLNISMKVIELPLIHFGKISATQLNIPKLYNEGRKVFIKKWSK